MAPKRIEIDHLHLRVPGLTRLEAQHLGRDVVRGLSQRFPSRTKALHLGALEIRVSVPPGTPKNHLPDLVVAAILRQIR